jgi:ubiquinone biosynthesis protein UbiJ
LTTIVNPSTGIHHPSDARHARQLLKTLYIAGEPLDEGAIRTWAIAHGWEPRHAAELGELAGKISAGKRVKGAAMNKSEAKQIIHRLQDAIGQPSQ